MDARFPTPPSPCQPLPSSPDTADDLFQYLLEALLGASERLPGRAVYGLGSSQETRRPERGRVTERVEKG